VPGKVENLTWSSSLNDVSLMWKKPSTNSHCVKHYVISWKHNINGNSASKNSSSEEHFCVIEGLDACVEYEVSVIAVNEKDQSTVAVTNATTETDGK
jgi:hypothetical protein